MTTEHAREIEAMRQRLHELRRLHASPELQRKFKTATRALAELVRSVSP